MIYRIVTGWYPSKNTAEKVFKKVSGKIHCEIVQLDVGFTVELARFASYYHSDLKKQELLKLGICCGIEAIDN